MSANIWWGDIQLDENQLTHWEIGPLVFSLLRSGSEWRLQHHADKDPDTTRFSLATTGGQALAKGESLRLHLSRASQPLSIRPLMGDRPFIIQTESALRLAPNSHINFYVTTVMRLGFFDGETLLADVAVYNNRDSWFGDFVSGELCYVSTTLARTQLGSIPSRRFRPVTPVLLENKSSEVLMLEKFKLPVPSLQLHCTSDGRLFTDGVFLLCEKAEEELQIRLNKHANPQLQAKQLVAAARRPLKESYGLKLQDFMQR